MDHAKIVSNLVIYSILSKGNPSMVIEQCQEITENYHPLASRCFDIALGRQSFQLYWKNHKYIVTSMHK